MPVINWTTTTHKTFTFLEFDLSDGLLRPSDLRDIDLPAELEHSRHIGLIISGRGPVWLYGHLLHQAHPFAWVAVFDPRLKGGIVVMNHLPDGPELGSVVPVQ